MKSIIKKVALIAVTAIFALGMAGCKPTVDTHEHTWDEGVVTTKPTCVTKGVKTYKCSDCEETKTEEIPELYSSPVDFVTGEAATADSEYVLFGVFPKTIKAADVTFDPEPETVTMGSNTYYKAKDGKYYAKVTAKPYVSTYKYSDGTPITKYEDYYFLVEPIKWKVLTTTYDIDGEAGSATGALLLAEDILTANVVPYYNYNSSSNTRTVGSDTSIYPNNYKYSQIRAYLNGLDYYYDESSTSTVKKTDYTGNGFLQTAFTSTAQLLIAETEIDNSDDSTTDTGNNITKATTYACENTTDKVFLLSEKEATTTAYGFAAYNSRGKGNARIRMPTDYAKANYAYQDSTTGYGGYWWLRSPLYVGSLSACNVDSDGRAYYTGSVFSSSNGVVPALCVSL